MKVKAMIVVMSHLSDAQEIISYDPRSASERINFAKYVMLQTSGDLNVEIDADEMYSNFKNR